MNFIRKIDFLGPKPTLKYDKYDNHKTLFGAVLSILCFLVLLAGSVFFTNILIERSNYSVLMNEEAHPNSFVNWTDREFQFNVIDKYGLLIPESDRVYGIVGTYWETMKGGGARLRPVEVERCNLDIHYAKHKDLYLNESAIEFGYCPKRNQTFLDTRKVYGASNYTGIVYWIHMCRNTTTKKDCYPEEKIREILSNVLVYIRFTDYYLDHKKQGEVSVPYVYSDIIQASVTVYKRVFYLFRNVEYYDDINYLYTENSQTNYSTFVTTKESVDIRPLSSTTIPYSFVAISLNNHIMKQSFYRKYYKLQNCIADLGGVIKGIIIICHAINYFFSGKYYKLDIINYNLRNYDVNDSPTPIARNIEKLDNSKSSIKQISVLENT
jgi:hypothetical protein